MKTKKRTILLIAAVLLIFAFIYYRKSVFSPKDINVLLISIDTCRADRLGCYGYDKNTTPNIDSFAAESVLFKSVISPIPFTFPSHLTVMTGTLPIFHGSHGNNGQKISDSHLTLAEILKEKGYKTAAFISSYVLGPEFGLDQGFDTYNEKKRKEYKEQKEFANGRRASETGQSAIEWLEENKDEKSFLFVHFYDPHFPYEPPDPFATEFKDSPYDGEIASVDFQIGRILDKLKELGSYHKTMIVIFSDHGELLGEHGEAGHGYFIYEGAIKVLLIIKVPGSDKPGKVEDIVGLVDITPTICGYLGIQAPDVSQGKDLNSYLKGKGGSKDRYLYTESLTATKFGANSLLGVVSGQYKYIQTTRPELYDVVKDPGENNDLIGKDPKRARLMQGNLKWILDTYAILDNREVSEVDVETIKTLESLGYIAGEVDPSLSFDQTKPDPKDVHYIHQLYRKAATYLILEEWDKAKEWCERVLAEMPDLELARQMLGRIWLAEVTSESDKAKAHEKVADMFFTLEKYDRAIENWNEVLKLGVDTFELRKKLAAANIHLKNSEEAVEHLKKSLDLNPDQADVNLTLGEIFSGLGQGDESLKYWENSLKNDPAQPELHEKLGKEYYQQGNLDKVVEHWTMVVELLPDNAEMLNNLAWIHSASRETFRNPQKGLEYALRACELTDYGQANFVDTLTVAYAANGRFSEAAETARKALNLAVSTGQQSLVDEIIKRQELYKTNQPYYDMGL